MELQSNINSGTLESLIQDLMPLTMEAEESTSIAGQQMETVEISSTATGSASQGEPKQLTDDPNTSNMRQRKKNPCKSQKIRFKALLSIGVPPSEAKHLAIKSFAELKKLGHIFPTSQTLVPTKRHRSEEESPQGHIKKAPKVRDGGLTQNAPSSSASQGTSQSPPISTGPAPTPMTYNKVASSIRVGIKHEQPMTNEQLVLLRDNILRKIIDLGKGEGPEFHGCSFRPGWLLVTCENQQAKTWLEATIPSLKPWAGAKLTVLGEKDLPQTHIATVYVPEADAKTPQAALALLCVQNKHLNTELWKVLNSKVERGGVTITFSLDDSSVEGLKKSDLKASLGFNKVQFRLKESSQQAPKTGTKTSPTPQASTSSTLPINPPPTTRPLVEIRRGTQSRFPSGRGTNRGANRSRGRGQSRGRGKPGRRGLGAQPH